MEDKFIKVSSTKNKITSLFTIILGCILVALPLATTANLIGIFLFITGLILAFTLKGCYKCKETGEIFCLKELYFPEDQKEKLLNAITSNPETIDTAEEDKGNALRLDIFYSKKLNKAIIQLFKYVPYQYEPCSEVVNCEYHKIEKAVK